MRTGLIQYLTCIRCGGVLRLLAVEYAQEEVLSGEMICETCKERYPVVRGIPRMLPGAMMAQLDPTAAAFGYEWKCFPAIDPLYEQQYLDWIAPVTTDFFKDKVVIDAGCGKGRHALWAGRYGAKAVLAVDLGDAVEVAHRNTRHLENVHIVQADLRCLPFKPGVDYIYSIGVLHHLADPESGFHSLVKLLKSPGGAISVWVYGKENNGWIVRLVNPLRSRVCSRLPLAWVRMLAFVLNLLFYPVVRGIYRPLNRRFPGIARHLFYNDYLSYIGRFGFRELHSIVFDHLMAPIAHYLKRDEVEAWFDAVGISNPQLFWHNRNSWRAFGVLTAEAECSEACSLAGVK